MDNIGRGGGDLVLGIRVFCLILKGRLCLCLYLGIIQFKQFSSIWTLKRISSKWFFGLRAKKSLEE